MSPMDLQYFLCRTYKSHIFIMWFIPALVSSQCTRDRVIFLASLKISCDSFTDTSGCFLLKFKLFPYHFPKIPRRVGMFPNKRNKLALNSVVIFLPVYFHRSIWTDARDHHNWFFSESWSVVGVSGGSLQTRTLKLVTLASLISAKTVKGWRIFFTFQDSLVLNLHH